MDDMIVVDHNHSDQWGIGRWVYHSSGKRYWAEWGTRYTSQKEASKAAEVIGHEFHATYVPCRIQQLEVCSIREEDDERLKDAH